MLDAELDLRVASDVFSRPEEEGRRFIPRPAGRRGPLVRLLSPHAEGWWTALERGTSWGDLSGGGDDALVGFVLALARDGFVESRACADLGATNRAAEAWSPVFEDPWQYQFSRPSLWSPWYVLWEVTDKCSQHCTSCYNPERENVQVGLGQAEATVRELIESKVPFVTLLGGEPLSNVHLEDVIRMLHAHRVYTKVITSGVPVSAARVARLKAAGLDQIALSIDALTPELNDRTRGKDAFHHFARARRLIGREIPCVTASLTVSNATLEQMDALGEFCREFDLDDVYLSQLRAVPGISYPPGIRPLTREEVDEMNRKAEALNAAGTKVIGVPKCSCGRSSAVLQPDGRLRACPFTPAPPESLVRGIGQTWTRIARKAQAAGPVTASSSCYRTFAVT